ncbi:MAG TPA: hypothetical protein DIT47_09320 [Flavobacteriaceae bacterium]|nr:hypothetical protein [Flavobacteriaceae bacterium]
MTRKEKLRAVLKVAVPKFELSLLTDKQLNDLEQIMKTNGLQIISIEKAVQQGFKIPENQNEIINQLIKFYKRWKKTN